MHVSIIKSKYGVSVVNVGFFCSDCNHLRTLPILSQFEFIFKVFVNKL